MIKSVLLSIVAVAMVIFGAVVMWNNQSGSCLESDPPQCTQYPGLFGIAILILCIAVAAVLLWAAWLRPRR